MEVAGASLPQAPGRRGRDGGVVLEDGVVQLDLDTPVVATAAASATPAARPSGSPSGAKPKPKQAGVSQKSKKGKTSKAAARKVIRVCVSSKGGCCG